MTTLLPLVAELFAGLAAGGFMVALIGALWNLACYLQDDEGKEDQQ